MRSAIQIILSRWRVRRASALLRKSRELHVRGRRIIEAEERRWGLAPCWRVPNVASR